MTAIITFGHGRLPAGQISALVRAAGIEQVVDIRSFPGSRTNPHVSRDEMEEWLPASGISYTWIRSLGGRRRPREDTRNTALRHDAFRGYADHMTTPDFDAGVDRLVALAAATASAVMCSEAVWWRCHRRLLADHLVLVRGFDVVHLMHDSRRVPHVPTEGVRLDDRRLVYDVGAAAGAGGRADAR